jgi:hypothetical protein
MNIHLDLWLIYLINLLPGINKTLTLITGLLLISIAIHIHMYCDAREQLNNIYQDFDKEKEAILHIKKEMTENRIANQISIREKAYKRGLVFMVMTIFIFCVGIFIPDKKDAIQLVKVNYINQSNMVLDDNSIDALSQNIDTILNSK